MGIDYSIALLKSGSTVVRTSRGVLSSIALYPITSDFGFDQVKSDDVLAGYPSGVASLCDARRRAVGLTQPVLYVSITRGLHHCLDSRHSVCPPDLFGLGANAFDWVTFNQTRSMYDFASRFTWPCSPDLSYLPPSGETYDRLIYDQSSTAYSSPQALLQELLPWLWGSGPMDTTAWTFQKVTDNVAMSRSAFVTYVDGTTGFSSNLDLTTGQTVVTNPVPTATSHVYVALPRPVVGTTDVTAYDVWHVTIPADVFAGCYTLGYCPADGSPREMSVQALRAANFGLAYCFVDTVFATVFANKWAPTTGVHNRPTVAQGLEGPLTGLFPSLPPACEMPTPLTSRCNVARYQRVNAIGCPEFMDGYTLVGKLAMVDQAHFTIDETAIGVEWRGSTLATMAAAVNSGSVSDRNSLSLTSGKSLWSPTAQTVGPGLISRLTSLGDLRSSLGALNFADAEDGRPAITFAQAEATAIGTSYHLVHRLAGPSRLEIPANANVVLLIGGATGALTWAYQDAGMPTASPADKGKVASLILGGCTVSNTSSLTTDEAVNELLASDISEIRTARGTVACPELNEPAMFLGGLADTTQLADNFRAGFELLQFARPRLSISRWINSAMTMARHASRSFKVSTY